MENKRDLSKVSSLAALNEIIEAIKCAYYDIHKSLIYFKDINTNEKNWEKLLKTRIKNEYTLLQDIFKLVGFKWSLVDNLIDLKSVEDETDETDDDHIWEEYIESQKD